MTALDRDLGELVVLDLDVLVLRDSVAPIWSFSTASPVTESTICRLSRLPVARFSVLNRTFSDEEVAG